jgi:hypothetical protein
MEHEAFVYMDFADGPVMAGRLWSRIRKGRESATFDGPRCGAILRDAAKTRLLRMTAFPDGGHDASARLCSPYAGSPLQRCEQFVGPLGHHHVTGAAQHDRA